RRFKVHVSTLRSSSHPAEEEPSSSLWQAIVISKKIPDMDMITSRFQALSDRPKNRSAVNGYEFLYVLQYKEPGLMLLKNCNNFEKQFTARITKSTTRSYIRKRLTGKTST